MSSKVKLTDFVASTFRGPVQKDDVRQYGMAKEGLIARQFMLGVVQTAEGLPIYHEVC